MTSKLLQTGALINKLINVSLDKVLGLWLFVLTADHNLYCSPYLYSSHLFEM